MNVGEEKGVDPPKVMVNDEKEIRDKYVKAMGLSVYVLILKR